MGHIRRSDVNEDWAHAGIVEAGDFVFVSYCVGNVGRSIEEQINGAFDHLIERLKTVGLDLDAVVQMDCLFRDIWNIPVMEKVIKERLRNLFTFVAKKEGKVFDYRDVAVKFTRNLPTDLVGLADVIVKLKEVCSQETLLAILPFIENPKVELDKFHAEQQRNNATSESNSTI